MVSLAGRRRILVVLALAAPMPVAAQRLPDMLRDLEPDRVVRVRTVNYGIHQGRITRLHPDTVYLAWRDRTAWVELSAIRDVWVREHSAKRGAVYGAFTAGILGGAFLAWFSHGVCDAAECPFDVEAAVGGAFAGGAFGAVTGALIGWRIPRWDPRFTRAR